MFGTILGSTTQILGIVQEDLQRHTEVFFTVQRRKRINFIKTVLQNHTKIQMIKGLKKTLIRVRKEGCHMIGFIST